MFGIGKNNQTINPQNIAMAEQEVEMMSDIFNRLVMTCHKKCISPKYYEADLTKGESVCIDRCVSKYFEANQSLSQHMQKRGQENPTP